MLYNLPKELLTAQLMDGLVLLVLGMGTVFVFLVILIYATKLIEQALQQESDSSGTGSIKRSGCSENSAGASTG